MPYNHKGTYAFPGSNGWHGAKGAVEHIGGLEDVHYPGLCPLSALCVHGFRDLVPRSALWRRGAVKCVPVFCASVWQFCVRSLRRLCAEVWQLSVQVVSTFCGECQLCAEVLSTSCKNLVFFCAELHPPASGSPRSALSPSAVHFEPCFQNLDLAFPFQIKVNISLSLSFFPVYTSLAHHHKAAPDMGCGAAPAGKVRPWMFKQLYPPSNDHGPSAAAPGPGPVPYPLASSMAHVRF